MILDIIFAKAPNILQHDSDHANCGKPLNWPKSSQHKSNGRPELTRKLLKEKAQSAKTDILARKPLELIQEARKNKGLYDNKGRRRQLLPQ